MEEYINGCYTKYGTRPLNVFEIKMKSKLKNGMYMVAGIIPNEEDGVSVDVYKDKDLKELVFMEHGIITNVSIEKSPEMFVNMAENRCNEMKI